MIAQTEPAAWERFRERVGRRGLSALLALLVEGLLILMFLFLAPNIAPKDKPKPTTLSFNLEKGDRRETKDAVDKQDDAPAPARKSDTRPEETRPKPQVEPTPLPPPPPVPPPNVLWLNRREFAASDIAKAERLPGPPAGAADADAGRESTGRVAGDSAIVGKAPNGEPLYAAEWYRRPTNAELSTYLPPGWKQNGWGLIACRTVANYRVEDCVEVADAPRGSRLAGAVRQAAFQFRVRPSRVGGKSMVGTWVQIRIDYSFLEKN